MVILYTYLWRDEHRQGREDGTKDRPCVVMTATAGNHGKTSVLVAPITHSEPPNNDGVSIPEATRARLRLDGIPQWVIVSEVNQFTWAGPDVRPASKHGFEYGMMPPKLFEAVQTLLLQNARSKKLAVVARTE